MHFSKPLLSNSLTLARAVLQLYKLEINDSSNFTPTLDHSGWSTPMLSPYLDLETEIRF